jgi:hypothetical protein
VEVAASEAILQTLVTFAAYTTMIDYLGGKKKVEGNYKSHLLSLFLGFLMAIYTASYERAVPKNPNEETPKNKTHWVKSLDSRGLVAGRFLNIGIAVLTPK